MIRDDIKSRDMGSESVFDLRQKYNRANDVARHKNKPTVVAMSDQDKP